MKNIFKIKKEVFQAKIKEINLNKSADWNMRELEEVLKDVGKNKARDPEGLDRSIFTVTALELI